MGKRVTLLAGALLLALVLSAGSYAYSFTAATATVDADTAIGIATSETASGQPDWQEVLPQPEMGQEILLVNAGGDLTQIPLQYPATGAHWDKVADSADETYVAVTGTPHFQTDLYRLADHAEGSGTINGVTVVFRFAGSGEGVPYTAYAKAAIKTNGTIYEGAEESQQSAAFVTKSYTWATNPKTGVNWTWTEIDALQAGASLKIHSPPRTAYLSQVFVIIDYELPPVIEGQVPTGDLFVVTPEPDYPGDLLIDIYLTNTGALKLAYKHLNIKVYVAGSLEAGESPNYRVLSLENGTVSFNIEGGTADSYTVEVTGGGYALISGDATQWGEGWEITPELFLEVTQR